MGMMCFDGIYAKAKRYLVAAAAFCGYFAAAKYIFGSVCPQMILIGLPCPGCGLTRAGIYFFTGRFTRSFEMHPLFVPVFLLILCCVVCKAFFPGGLKRFYVPAAVLAVCLFAVYAARMKVLFPDCPPMIPKEDSVLFKILYLIKGDF